MSPEELLVPMLLASIVIAVVLFAVAFLRQDASRDPAPGAPPSGAPDPQEVEESDGWYFERHRPAEHSSDLSLP